MTYIVHFNLGRNGGVRYGTVDEENLHVSYQPILRTKRVGRMGIREMERAGSDKSRVWLRFSSQTIVNELGTKGVYPGNTQFRILDRHKHIKRLRPEDEATIGDADAVIAAKKEELGELRKQRRELVAGAWRRGLKIAPEELEERADTHEP